MRLLATYAFFSIFFSLTTLYAGNPIIVISIDGLRPDALSRADAKFMLDLIEKGTLYDHARTVRPSVTVPAHVSMLTGLDPKQHGFWWDDYRPTEGPVRNVTALEIANKAGLHVAMIVAKEKLIPLNRPHSVDYFEQTEREGAAVAEAFKHYIEKNGVPDLTFLHLPDPDKAGHERIWMSPFYFEGVRDADNAVKSIMEAATILSKKRPTILITADHGGTGLSHLLDIDTNNKIPFIINGEGIAAGVVKHEAIKVYDTAPTILSLLNLSIPKAWVGKPIRLKN